MKTLLLPLTIFTASLLSIDAATPIAVTGANADLIWEGGSNAATSFDTANDYTYIGSGINFTGLGSPGVPQSFTSVNDASLAFELLGEYNEYNALQLAEGESGTLTLATPAAYSTIYLLTATASGTAVGTVTITFSDTSTLVLDYTSLDWYTDSDTIAWEPSTERSIRVKTTTGSYYYSGATGVTAPYMYSYELAIPEAYQGLNIESLTFDITETGDDNLSSAIFGISGVAVPEPSISLLGAVGLLAMARRRRVA